MISVIFKNLAKSDLAREAAFERLLELAEKFPDLRRSRITITLEMHNSPQQAGPDLFTVKALVRGGRYAGIKIEKPAHNLYVALADTVEHLHDLLNRHTDKRRVSERNKARNTLRRLRTI
jgi:ribosome-associated translation inhibitor RaiA